MVDRVRDRRRRGGELVRRDVPPIITAAAEPLYGTPRETYALQRKTWQDELWEYSRSVGEYGSVMDWFAAGISRHHLVAGVLKPGLREPEPLDDGPAAELVANLVSNARGGETQYLYKWGRHLGIGGVGYFVAWDTDTAGRVFDVKSSDQIRRSTRGYRDPVTGALIKDARGNVVQGFDVRVSDDRWEQLPRESLVGRIYRPDDRLDYEVTSWSAPALTTLREIDLFNRHIVASLLSRIVFNGFLLIPNEIVFPVNPQFKDHPDPFIAELLAAAANGIKDPGSPLSALPFPLRIPAEYIEKIQHLVIANGIDEKIVKAREDAVAKLARMLPAPPEAMEGKSNLNHWNAWADTADNIKMYFGPTMEVLVGGLTEFYLWPMLRAGGDSITQSDGSRLVVWYDNSDLIADPDNSENVRDARDRVTISEDAYLAGMRLDKADKASDEERRKMILTDLARQGLPIPDSFFLLYPEDKPEGLTPGIPTAPPTPPADAEGGAGPLAEKASAGGSNRANGDAPNDARPPARTSSSSRSG